MVKGYSANKADQVNKIVYVNQVNSLQTTRIDSFLKPNKPNKLQEGFALLTVLLVVALISMVSSQLIYDQQLNIQRSSYMIHQAHSVSVAFGFEDWVKKGLKADLEDNKIDHLAEQWAQPLIPVAFADGMVSGEMADLQAKINVNNVLAKNTAQRLFWKKMIVRSLQQNLPEYSFLGFGDVLKDWIDADDETLEMGAESDHYLLNQPAFRTANHPMVMVSELKNLKDMQALSPGQFNLLANSFCALPTETTINVNTADVPVIMALSDWLSEDIAKQWLQVRKQEPAKEVKTFLDFLEEKTGFSAQEIANDIPAGVLSVNTQYFLLKAQVDYGEVKQVVFSIFNRKSESEVTLVQRWLSVA